jgi:hypothetical protein
MGCMRDLSTVRGYLPDIQHHEIDVLLLDIHTLPGRDVLGRFGFEFTPTYLIYHGDGEEIFRSNTLPMVNEIIKVVDS